MSRSTRDRSVFHPTPKLSSQDMAQHAAEEALVKQLRRINDIFTTKRLPLETVRRLADGIETATRGVEPGLSRLGEGGLDSSRWLHFEWNPTHSPLLFERTSAPGAAIRLEARCTCGAAFEGPPAAVHGGHVALMFDDALGALVDAQKREDGVSTFYVTASLHVNYRRLTPLNTEIVVTAWVDRQQGRKMWVKATMGPAGGETTAEAEGLFIAMRQEEPRSRL